MMLASQAVIFKLSDEEHAAGGGEVIFIISGLH